MKQRLRAVLAEFAQLDLRKSYLIIGGLIVIGAVVNFVLPHGWTVWPFVLAVGILTFINEAVDRNGQGIPPVKVYAFFFSAIGLWLGTVMVLSAMNPLIIFLGIAAILYRCAQAYLKQRERDRLILSRREAGCCIHCGERYDPRSVLCESCGDEPNPDEALLKRVAGVYRSQESIDRARAVLSQSAAKMATGGAAAKEKALLARSRSGKVAQRTVLPKAAKLGGSGGTSRNKLR